MLPTSKRLGNIDLVCREVCLLATVFVYSHKNFLAEVCKSSMKHFPFEARDGNTWLLFFFLQT